ncbi:MAG: choloylglycine hydrolase [Clostridia bacterium]|nr:choloylglycine hydrolase [Clostridia bacterium]
MCTAATYLTQDFYFGRTLDINRSYSEEVTVTPRNFPLSFRHMGVLETHHAIIGMALVADGYPLYFDAVNEKGLAMAGLNFVGYAHYNHPVSDRNNIATFELIPWLLGRCASVAEAREALGQLNITDDAFSPQFPPSQLHWMVADRTGAITVEAVREGLRIYDNPVGVLTNNPPFDRQLFHLNNYMGLSPRDPENRFAPGLDLQVYSHGMGALGLPGDLSSQSRFVRAAFTRLNACSGHTEEQSVSQFFHILGTVEHTRGCSLWEKDEWEITAYTCCCNADKGIYYYTTYENRQISAVHLHREDVESRRLVCYPLISGQQIRHQN